MQWCDLELSYIFENCLNLKFSFMNVVHFGIALLMTSGIISFLQRIRKALSEKWLAFSFVTMIPCENFSCWL